MTWVMAGQNSGSFLAFSSKLSQQSLYAYKMLLHSGRQMLGYVKVEAAIKSTTIFLLLLLLLWLTQTTTAIVHPHKALPNVEPQASAVLHVKQSGPLAKKLKKFCSNGRPKIRFQPTQM